MLRILTIVALMGCAPTYPLTTSVHAPSDQAPKPRQVLVWSNHPSVESMLRSWRLDQGCQVIDATRVSDVAQEQHLLVSPDPDLERNLLVIARLLNADEVLLGAVMFNSHPVTLMYAGHKEGGERVTTLYDPTVTVRSLIVNTGAIRWSVTASGPTPVFVPGQTIRELTDTVLKRAICEAESDHEWQDGKGCLEKP